MDLPDDIPRAHLPLSDAAELLDTALQLGAHDPTSGREPAVPPDLAPAFYTFLAHRHGPRAIAHPAAAGPPEVQAFRDHVFALMTTVPDAATLARAPTLTRWCPVRTHKECMLIGRVNGHPALRENARTLTSQLFRIAPAEGWARTWSRIYRLIDPDPAFFIELQRDRRLPPTAEIVWEMMPASSRH